MEIYQVVYYKDNGNGNIETTSFGYYSTLQKAKERYTEVTNEFLDVIVMSKGRRWFRIAPIEVE